MKHHEKTFLSFSLKLTYCDSEWKFHESKEKGGSGLFRDQIQSSRILTVLHQSSSSYLPASLSHRIIITPTFFLFFSLLYIKNHPLPPLLSFCPEVRQKETSISYPPYAIPRLLLLFSPTLPLFSLSFRLILSSILPITSTIPIVVNLSETFRKLAVIAGRRAPLQWGGDGGRVWENKERLGREVWGQGGEKG